MNTILFTLVYREQELLIQTRPRQYPSLMSLIADRLAVAGFGLCSGMGSCGTCVVSIDGIRNLSCALPIADDLANTRIVLNDTYW